MLRIQTALCIGFHSSPALELDFGLCQNVLGYDLVSNESNEWEHTTKRVWGNFSAWDNSRNQANAVHLI